MQNELVQRTQEIKASNEPAPTITRQGTVIEYPEDLVKTVLERSRKLSLKRLIYINIDILYINIFIIKIWEKEHKKSNEYLADLVKEVYLYLYNLIIIIIII